MAKATNIMSRRPMAPPKEPYERISMDWFSFEQAYNGMIGCTIMKCDLTSVIIVVLGEGKNCIGLAIKSLDARIYRHYGLHICQVRSDNKPTLGKRFPA